MFYMIFHIERSTPEREILHHASWNLRPMADRADQGSDEPVLEVRFLQVRQDQKEW